MGFLGSPYRRHPRRFDPTEEPETHGRLHFKRLNPYHRDRGRSVILLAVMIGVVSYLLFVLSKVKG